MDFPATVAPFILRGVALYGIDSVHAPPPLRRQAWARLASDLDPGKLAAITSEVGLADALAAAPEVLAGKVRGRIAVDVRR
jgi:acrylyl-CoA reductase (NADPH)